MEVSAPVREALAAGKAVVALETAVLTHGLPRPLNLETVLAQVAAVRKAGAVPAVVGVWRGSLTVGLSDEQLAALAGEQEIANRESEIESQVPSPESRHLIPQTPNPKPHAPSDPWKVNLQNLAACCAAGANGGATVSVTMHAAHKAGISVMATGGIGGVHFITTHDVSSDIAALASIPMLVVCAGPKAVLDIEATLELLETHGVPLIGYGADDVPAFYSRTSGYPSTARADTAADAARLFRTHRSLGIPVAMMLCQPPPEDLAIPPEEVETAVWNAATAAKQSGVRGSALTPYLLSAMSEHFGDRALTVNTHVLIANASLAAEVAVELAAHSG